MAIVKVKKNRLKVCGHWIVEEPGHEHEPCINCKPVFDKTGAGGAYREPQSEQRTY